LSARLPEGYSLRPRREADGAALLGIENRAAEMFRAYGYGAVADNPFPDVASMQPLFSLGETWLATTDADQPVAFIVIAPLGRYLHIHELSVDPGHGRKRLGSALVRLVIAAAERQMRSGVSLTTFRDVPFNAPFYEKLGFSAIADAAADPHLAARLETECPEGVPLSSRVLMVRHLTIS
jgi:ribosomal protein S18 acetylase RimI-like enzyme